MLKCIFYCNGRWGKPFQASATVVNSGVGATSFAWTISGFWMITVVDEKIIAVCDSVIPVDLGCFGSSGYLNEKGCWMS